MNDMISVRAESILLSCIQVFNVHLCPIFVFPDFHIQNIEQPVRLQKEYYQDTPVHCATPLIFVAGIQNMADC